MTLQSETVPSWSRYGRFSVVSKVVSICRQHACDATTGTTWGAIPMVKTLCRHAGIANWQGFAEL